MENQNNLPTPTEEQEKDIVRELLNVAIDECGFMPLVCFGLCVIMGTSIGGLIGYKVFIDTRK